MKERKWESIRACPSFKGKSLSTAISKVVIRLVRHKDQEERETDGAVHWNTMSPKLLKAFEDKGARKFSDKEWLQHIYEGSNKTSTASVPKIPWCIFVQLIQRRTGGNMTAPELMGHVAIPHNWREFVFHGGCSFNLNSILEAGFIAGGKTNHLLHTSHLFFGEKSR